jgi:O-antigen ligase
MAPSPAPSAAAAPLAWLLATVVLMSEAIPMTLLKTAPESLVAPIAQASYLAAYAIAGWTLLRGRQALRLGVGFWLIGGLIAWFGVTIFWSISPIETAQKVAAQGGTIVVALAWASLGMRRAVGLLGGGLFCIGAAAVALAWAAPDLGVMKDAHVGAWSGLWLDKNRMGAILGLGVLTCLAVSASSTRAWAWRCAAAALALAILPTGSATATLATLAGALVAAGVFLVRRGPRLALAAGAGALAFGAIAAALLLASPAIIAEIAGRDTTFTGRADIWAAVGRRIAEAPWTGYGYGAFWETAPGPADWIRQDIDFTARNAHQAWLELRLDGGWPAAVLAGLALVFAGLRGAGRLLSGRGAYFVLPALTFLTLTGFSESILAQPNSLPWAVFMMILFLLDQPKDAPLDPADAA